MNNSSVKITHPNGVPMKYSENLIGFLTNRTNKSIPFYFGDWLMTIGNDDLGQLIFMARLWMEGAEEIYLDDIVSVAITALSAETNNQTHRVSPQDIENLVGTVFTDASLEAYRRKGWINILSTLSIDPLKEIKMEFTALGEEQAAHLKAMFN